ncbi:MAG: hypothetical protein FJ104_06180, partial [Deltaproteobacteria bacterium]|nr:hypothetical protein [Deltaproteobacteria bacterium]
HRVFGFLCAARILGVRPDVVYVDAFLVDRPWYRARVARALGTTVPDDARAEQILALAARAGRPVFLAGLPELQARLPAVPHGTVLRVLRRDELRPDAEALEASNRLLFQGFHLDDPAPRIQWSWAGDARTAYARAWVAIGQAHLTEGRPERALAAWTEASRLAPWLRLEVH